jgi:hypothetical protein
LRRISGTTDPSGLSAKRSIASGTPLVPVTMQVRSDPAVSLLVGN